MPNHYVNFKIPTSELGKADAIFNVSDDNGKIGTIKISHGAIEWRPSGNEYSYRVAWRDFHKAMTNAGTRLKSK